MVEEMDNIEEFEAQETRDKLPWGWVLLMIGLIIWGIIYFISYTPQISGWSQERAFLEQQSSRAAEQ